MKRNFSGLVAVALVAGATMSCTPKDESFSFTYAEKRAKIKSNGLRVAVMPMKSTELVEVDVRYEVGSREDPPGKAGLAHLVEHLMFQQKPDGQDTPPLMHHIGQLSNFFNAYTNWDTTHYMTQSRAELLDALLKIEAMRMFYRCETISEDEFAREREVVRNEIRQRSGTPEGLAPQILLTAAYPKGHAYEQMIGGNDAQLTSITLKDACDFMDKYYVPERATVIIAGKVEVDEAIKLAEKWFAKIPKGTPGARKVVEPYKMDTKREEVAIDLERTVVNVIWPLPDSNTNEGEAAQWAIQVLTGNLAQEADEWDFATQVAPGILGGSESPIFTISIELKSDSDIDKALEFVWKSAKNAHRPFEDGVFDTAKVTWEADFVAQIESLTDRTNLFGELVQFDKEVDWDSNQEFMLKAMADIKKTDGGFIRGVVKRVLDPDKAKVVIMRAKKDGLAGDKRADLKFATKSHDKEIQPEVDPAEAKRPLPVSAEVKIFDAVERYTLGNGMRIVLLPYSDWPTVAARLVFDVGGSHEPADKAGLASITARMLRGGSGNAMAATGISVRASVDDDTTVFAARAMTPYLEQLIRGLEREIVAGNINQEGIEGWQKSMKYRLDLESTRQEMEFERQFALALYGEGHPYAELGSPTRKTIGNIGRDAAMAFKNKHYSAKNATLIIAGKFDAKKAKSYIANSFGDWSGGHNDEPVASKPRTRVAPEYIGVVSRELPQMTVSMAYPTAAGIDGQQAARMVLANMLNQKMGDIRFKLGSTYGTYAGHRAQLAAGAYQMGGTVDAARAGESLAAMRDGVDALRRGEEFDLLFARARRQIVQQLIGQSGVSTEIAARLGTIAKYSLDPNYYETLLQQVAAVSTAQIHALIESELRPDTEIVVCMADRATLTKAFAEAGLNNTKIIEVE